MLRLLFPLVLLVVCSGCTRSYWQNRGKDFLDIVTLTAGPSVGAIAHVGPVNAGLGYHGDVFGIRGGEAGTPIGFSGELLFGGVDACGIKQGLKTNSEDLNRHKSYFLANVIVPLPMDALFDAPPTPMVTKTTTFGGTTIQKSDQNTRSIPAPYWTNIEVSAGVLVGVRVGFNPGELLDFLVGFTTLDIYGDDVHPDAFEKAGFVDPEGMRKRMQKTEQEQTNQTIPSH